jgi:hypothetical protein
VIRAVYVVPYASGDEGVNVAVESASVTVPATGFVPLTRNVVVETLAGATASENVAVTVVPMATLVAAAVGVTAMTVGGVRSGGASVLKSQM